MNTKDSMKSNKARDITNAMESLNSAIRKFTKIRTVFPTDDSLFKSLYLV